MADLDISVQIDKAAVAKLSTAIERIHKYTGRSLYQSVMYAAVKVCQSGRRDSKPGMKRRKIRPDPMVTRMKGAKKSDAGGFVDILSQHKPVRVVRVSGPTDKNVEIKRHGLARRLWNIMAAKAAATKSGTAVEFGRWYSFTAREQPEQTTATIKNKLSYLTKVYPMQQARIYEAASKALEWETNRKLGIIIDQAKKAS